MRLRRSTSPPPPPHEDAERLGGLPEDVAFLTGNGFAARCRHVINYDGLVVNEHVANDWWFCKVDHLDWFFAESLPRQPFVLISHNGDYPIGERYRRQLRRRQLRAWFAANVALRHPKLIPIPLGIANPVWPHGDPRPLRAAQAGSGAKSELFDVSFGIETNEPERTYCLEQIALPLLPRLRHAEYLARLASTYFCIAPSGHGLDTHRMWEALYVRSVPVVTRSSLVEEYAELPLVVLDDWSEFRTVDFSPELHRRLTSGWDPSALSADAFVERLERRLATL
jgi:hypothetical protein